MCIHLECSTRNIELLLKIFIVLFFLPISIHTLEYISIRLTDQNLNEINVRGEEVTMRLEIRSIDNFKNSYTNEDILILYFVNI